MNSPTFDRELCLRFNSLSVDIEKLQNAPAVNRGFKRPRNIADEHTEFDRPTKRPRYAEDDFALINRVALVSLR